MSPTIPTLADFEDWVSDAHGRNFDAMDGATDGAYPELLEKFVRLNGVLNLLREFKEDHARGFATVSNEGDAA